MKEIIGNGDKHKRLNMTPSIVMNEKKTHNSVL